ncbi:MAG: hypothetical protein WCO00_04415 [Rhodospirillaceae bacterium]
MNTVSVIIWADSFVRERNSKRTSSFRPVVRTGAVTLGLGASAVASAVLKAQRD